MQVIKFPNVNNEYWDGSGLKKKHLKHLATVIKREEEIKAAARIVERLVERLDSVETVRMRLKKDLEKAKTDYYKILSEDAE